MVGDGPPDHIDASMKGPSRRRGNCQLKISQSATIHASMKGPSRRRGNSKKWGLLRSSVRPQ